jgi:hypothetical protein
LRKITKIFQKYFKNKKLPKGQQRVFIVLSKMMSILQKISNNLNKTQFGQGLLHENMSQKFGTLW